MQQNCFRKIAIYKGKILKVLSKLQLKQKF